MSKSVESPLGTIGLLDSDEDITRKVRKAVTDTDGEMRYDREAKPGLANLLDLLAAATGRTAVEVAAGYTRYGDLKNDVAAALCELLRPVRERRAELEDDLPYVDAVLARGAARAHEVAAATYARAAGAMGLLPSVDPGLGPGRARRDAGPPVVEAVEEPRQRAVGVQEEVQHHETRGGSASCTGGSGGRWASSAPGGDARRATEPSSGGTGIRLKAQSPTLTRLA